MCGRALAHTHPHCSSPPCKNTLHARLRLAHVWAVPRTTLASMACCMESLARPAVKPHALPTWLAALWPQAPPLLLPLLPWLAALACLVGWPPLLAWLVAPTWLVAPACLVGWPCLLDCPCLLGCPCLVGPACLVGCPCLLGYPCLLLVDTLQALISGEGLTGQLLCPDCT